MSRINKPTKLRGSLTKKEQVILADMWEDLEIRRTLIKLFGKRQLQLAQLTLQSSADHYWTVEQRGRANELVHMVDFLGENLKSTNNERQAANSNM